MDNSTTTPVPSNKNITYSIKDFCSNCQEPWYSNIAYCFAVIFCCPCICIDKCGGCKQESVSTPNDIGYGIAVVSTPNDIGYGIAVASKPNDIGYGIAVGMMLRQ
jgi:hypothetical protein